MKTFALRKPIARDSLETFKYYPELVAELLASRGITTHADAERFLSPDYERDVSDPFLMKDMGKAVTRILEAIQKNECIGIFSDYDADGIPGAVILHDFLKKIGFANFENYIPHRHDEGFGMNKEAVDELSGRGVSLLITVDCGIANTKEVAHAESCGMDVIITDHHLPSGNGIPKAYAVLDSKQSDCSYPDKNLCGSGVAFKLVHALLTRGPSALHATRYTLPALGWEKWLLDMVGIATLSDMVPLVGENRALAHYGLLVLRKSPRPGLQKLFSKTGVNQRHLSEDDIVFSVTPKLNAASRMGSALSAFKLLSTTDEAEAGVMTDELLQLNNERKGVVGSLVREVKKIMAERYSKVGGVIVMGNPAWRPSLLGLAANALVKEHARPVFLWGRDGEDVIKGSCRSDGSVNVVTLMREAGEVFVEYGGHAQSGGFTVVNEKIHVLEETLMDAYTRVKTEPQETDTIFIDKKISPDDVTLANFRLIDGLGPFGQGNPKPLFLLENVPVKDVKFFGKEKNHLELSLPRSEGSVVKAIRFFAEDIRPPVAGALINLVASMELSSFAGRSELRLRIVDIL